MSQHQKTDFKHFTKFSMDLALAAHGLESTKPSQLADAFRIGAEYGYQRALDSHYVQLVPPRPIPEEVDKDAKS